MALHPTPLSRSVVLVTRGTCHSHQFPDAERHSQPKPKDRQQCLRAQATVQEEAHQSRNHHFHRNCDAARCPLVSTRQRDPIVGRHFHDVDTNFRLRLNDRHNTDTTLYLKRTYFDSVEPASCSKARGEAPFKDHKCISRPANGQPTHVARLGISSSGRLTAVSHSAKIVWVHPLTAGCGAFETRCLPRGKRGNRCETKPTSKCGFGVPTTK